MRPIVTACHRPRSRLLQRVALLVALASGWGLPPGRAEASPAMQAAPSACLPNAAKVVSPGLLLAGETATVTLSFSAACPGLEQPLHLVLVLDESGTMSGDRIQQLQEAVQTIILDLQLADNPSTQVGIVAFQSVARTLCKLMNDEGRLVSCARQLKPGGGKAIDRGIIEGLRVLGEGRNGLGADVEPNEVVIVVSDGPNNAGCNPVKSAARRAKGQGVLVITVCVGSECDAQCLRESASSARYYFEMSEPGQLVEVFRQLRASLEGRTLRSLILTDTLPATMQLVEGSVSPAAEQSADHKSLRWELQGVAGTTQVSYRIRPLAAGSQPVSVGAIAIFRDSLNREGRAAFPIPRISVFGSAPADGGARDSLKLSRPLSAMAARGGY